MNALLISSFYRSFKCGMCLDHLKNFFFYLTFTFLNVKKKPTCLQVRRHGISCKSYCNVLYCSALCVPQRHFAVFAVSFPNQEALSTIYTSILSQHLAYATFPGTVQRFASQLVQGALALHNRISSSFLPTAVKFHYIFNLRDLSNIFQVYGFSIGEMNLQ